jgi:hypothetical protein
MPKLLLITILLLALSPSLLAQRFKGAIMGGMNICQVDGDEVYGYKRVGGTFGVAAILPIKNFDITLETNYSQEGAKEKQQYNYYDSTVNLQYTGQYDLHLNYVQVPLVAHYTDKERYTFGAGFSYGRLVSSSEEEHGGGVAPYSDTVPFNKNDWDVLLDLQVRIWKQLKFNVRFSYSMVPIRERTFYDVIYKTDEPWTRKQYNHLLTFRLVWVFNEKFESKKPKGGG